MNFQHRYLAFPNVNGHKQENSFNALLGHNNDSPWSALMKRRPLANFQHRYLTLPNVNNHAQENSFDPLLQHNTDSPLSTLMAGSNQVDLWHTNNAGRRRAASSRQGIFALAPAQMAVAWFGGLLGLASLSRGILSSIVTNGIEQQLINGN